jgi:hypothetical protein
VAATGFLGLAGCAPVADPVEPVTETKIENTAAISTSTASTANAELPDSLKSRLELAIEHVRSRQLYTTNAFWTIFHGILGLGPGLAIVEPRSGTKVNALDYIFGGNFELGEIRGMRFIPTEAGLDVQTGPQFVGQGHQDQFIAEIAQWNTPIDKKVIVHGREYTLMDFVREIQAHVRTEGQELSWAIVAIGQYLGTDVVWKNRQGETVHYEDVVRFEKDASVTEAACGGTHRLFGLTWALHLHLRAGGELTGIWKEVSDHLDRHVALAKEYQNPDGSFSSNYFRGKGSTTDPKDRLGSSGHTLEWLAATLTDEQLREPWMRDGAHAVAMMILDIQSAEMESGALYHATHGLILYYARTFGWDKFRMEQAPTLSGEGGVQETVLKPAGQKVTEADDDTETVPVPPANLASPE